MRRYWNPALGAATLIIGVELIVLSFSGEAPLWLALVGAAVVGFWHAVWIPA